MAKRYEYTTAQLMPRITASLQGAEGLSIVGPDGKPWGLGELNAWWGAEIRVIEPVPHPEAPFVVAVHELRVTEGPATQIVRVVDEHGNPVDQAAVCRWWADAPYLPPLADGCHATYHRDRAVVGWTNAGGDVGFGMGKGDMPGTSGVWVAHCQAPAGAVFGLGWKPVTNHAAVIVTFQVRPAHPEPSIPPPEPPGPDDCPREEVLSRAGEAGRLLKLAKQGQEAAWELLNEICILMEVPDHGEALDQREGEVT